MPTALVQPLVPGPIKQTRILLPENVHYRKVVLFKMRLRRGEPWFGGSPITVPYNLDIDHAEIDGMTIRKHIHQRMTGVLEMRYGEFIWQESDQMQATTLIQEVEETDWLRNKDRIWSQFVRWEGDNG